MKHELHRDSTKTGSVLCFIKLLRRSMCKFHRGLNVHKPQAVFSPSQTWKTALQEFMMSRSRVEV